jgi:hypothetical protein
VQVLSSNRVALKEWASVCGRLARGEQILLLRKGGIREAGFRAEQPEFFLFPTRFHEKDAAPAEAVDLELYAEIAEDVEVKDLEALRRLEGQHAMAWEDVEKRFLYAHNGRAPGLHVLSLRVHRLRQPLRVEDARAYDGCVSWVQLDRDRPVATAGPALSCEEFERRREAVRAALDG